MPSVETEQLRTAAETYTEAARTARTAVAGLPDPYGNSLVASAMSRFVAGWEPGIDHARESLTTAGTLAEQAAADYEAIDERARQAAEEGGEP